MLMDDFPCTGSAGLVIAPLLFGTASGPSGSLTKDYRWAAENTSAFLIFE